MTKQFQTQDFYLAAAAMAKNFELVDFYRVGGFTTFVFTETPELITYVKKYYSETTIIEPVKHSRAIKSLKSLIHSLSISTSNHIHKNEHSERL